MYVPQPRIHPYVYHGKVYLYSPPLRSLSGYQLPTRWQSRGAASFSVSAVGPIVGTIDPETGTVTYENLLSGDKLTTFLYGVPVHMSGSRLILLSSGELLGVSDGKPVKYGECSDPVYRLGSKVMLLGCGDTVYIFTASGATTVSGVQVFGAYGDGFFLSDGSSAAVYQVAESGLRELPLPCGLPDIEVATSDGRYVYYRGKLYDTKTCKAVVTGYTKPDAIVGTGSIRYFVYRKGVAYRIDVANRKVSGVDVPGKMVFTDGTAASFNDEDVGSLVLGVDELLRSNQEKLQRKKHDSQLGAASEVYRYGQYSQLRFTERLPRHSVR